MGMFKWLRKDINQRDQNHRFSSAKLSGLNNETYRNAMKAFIDRRKNSRDREYIEPSNSPDKARLDFLFKKNFDNGKNKNNNRVDEVLPGVPHVQISDIFEIGCVAGTKDRYLELVYSEWQNTRVSLRKHVHPDCKNAIKADLEVLSEIRHPNILLLMGTSYTKEQSLVAIFESVDCTLFNYIHKQGERISIQGIAKCAGNLAAALKHAHMRGYIHGAISPHCVFLVSSGLVKLGGWELATNTNKSENSREYEECLRSEIFRWLAPEIHALQAVSAATDIYGLSLLMWEMATMTIPWSNMNHSEVKLQYIQWKHCVMTDLHNFPDLFQNLLEAGLQIDVTKRTVDMPKMCKFLQRLELQHEDEEPIYVEILTGNNNTIQRTNHISPITISPASSMYATTETPNRYRRSTAPQQSSEDENRIGSHESFLTDRTFYEDIPKNIMTTSQINFDSIDFNHHSTETVQKEREEEQTEIANSRKIGASTQLSDSMHEDSLTDSRQNIKMLKASLASKRECFFYGSNPPHPTNPEQTKDMKAKILFQAKSKNYEPHKPASHKTSFEPKQNTSKSPYGTYTKSNEASTQTSVTLPVKDTLVQSKVLNTDVKNSFERSFWKKEKMICLSKMGPIDPKDSITLRNNQDSECTSPASNKTFLVTADNSIIENSKDQTDNFMTATDFPANLTENSNPKTTSLQILKNALDKATELARARTPPPSECGSNDSVLFMSPKSFNDISENLTVQKSLFEDLYKLNDFHDTEIRSIEKSSSSEDTYVIESKQAKPTGTCNSIGANPPSHCNKTRPAPSEVLRSLFYCKSIAETSNEYEFPSTRDQRDTAGPSGTESIVRSNEKYVFCSQPTADLNDKFRSAAMTDEQYEEDLAFLVFDDEKKERECFSNPKSNLPRRRSLPAALGPLRNMTSPSLGKLPIRRGNIADNTVEDLYIDDEFGDGLAVNMILLDEDSNLMDDEDFLPHLLEFSNSCDNQ